MEGIYLIYSYMVTGYYCLILLINEVIKHRIIIYSFLQTPKPSFGNHTTTMKHTLRDRK